MTSIRFAALGGCLMLCANLAWAQAPDLSSKDLVLKSVPDGPVAIVDGQPVRSEAFRDLYMGEMLRWARLNGDVKVPDEERLGIAINSLRVLIEREVLYQEAARRKLSVTDSELQEKWSTELDDLKKRVAKEGEPALTEADVLKRAGTTRDEAMNELRKAMMVDKLRDIIIKEKGVTVSDQEVADWFAQNKSLTRRPDMLHLKQIFFKPSKTKPTPQEKAADAYNRIKSGQSFEGVARQISEGQYKDDGGEWPVMPADKFPAFIQAAANKLKPGDISEPIESEYGVHIIKLIEAIPGEETSVDTAAPRIKEMLLASKGSRVVSEFCSKVTGDSARVQVFLDLQRQLELRPDLLQKLTKDAPQAKAPAAPPAKPASAPKGAARKAENP